MAEYFLEAFILFLDNYDKIPRRNFFSGFVYKSHAVFENRSF